MTELTRWLDHAALWLRTAAASAPPPEAGYRDVAPLPAEQVSAPLHVALAYGLIWVVLVAFLLFLWRRQGRLAAEIERLRGELRGADTDRRAR